MQYKTKAEIEGLGHVVHAHELSKNERLERWAQALEAHGGERLRTLRETEYQPLQDRLALREEGSPLTVAFADPILRSAGLKGDTFGDAVRFFELSHDQLHGILCYCHFGETMSSGEAARRVRQTMDGNLANVTRLARGCALGAGAVVGLTWLALAI